MLHSDWLRTFWPMSQEQKFSQIWDFCRNTANINFHYRSNSVKINDQIFQGIEKNPVFGPFWAPFFKFWGQKKTFLENLALSHTTLNVILAPCQNLEKINATIPRKHPDRQDRQTLFYRTILVTAWGPINDMIIFNYRLAIKLDFRKIHPHNTTYKHKN